MAYQTKSEFQKELETMLERNKQIIEDVELKQLTADGASLASSKLFCDFINSFRYPGESKAKILSGLENESTQILNQ